MAKSGGENNPGCNCCEGVCVCEEVITSLCTGALGVPPDVTIYYLTTSGWSDGDICSECDAWNVTDLELCYVGSDTWESASESGTPCNHLSGDPLYRLSYAGGFYTLKPVGLSSSFKIASGSWNCQGTNTIPIDVSSNDCDNPSSITITPCVRCAHCTTTVPSQVKFQISDLTNNANPLCETDWLDEYVLDSIGECRWAYNETEQCSRLNITLTVNHQAGNYYWEAVFDYTGTFASGCGIFPGCTIRWQWDSVTPFDCTVNRTLPIALVSDFFHCLNWGTSTVAITPL